MNPSNCGKVLNTLLRCYFSKRLKGKLKTRMAIPRDNWWLFSWPLSCPPMQEAVGKVQQQCHEGSDWPWVPHIHPLQRLWGRGSWAQLAVHESISGSLPRPQKVNGTVVLVPPYHHARGRRFRLSGKPAEALWSWQYCWKESVNQLEHHLSGLVCEIHRFVCKHTPTPLVPVGI